MNDVSFQNPSRQILESFMRLQKDVSFQDVLQWLQDCMVIEALNSAKMENDWQRNISSGIVQAIDNILKINSEARERIEREQQSQLEDRKAGSY